LSDDEEGSEKDSEEKDSEEKEDSEEEEGSDDEGGSPLAFDVKKCNTNFKFEKKIEL